MFICPLQIAKQFDVGFPNLVCILIGFRRRFWHKIIFLLHRNRGSFIDREVLNQRETMLLLDVLNHTGFKFQLFFQNFWDVVWLFVLSRLFRLLSSSLLLYSQRFDRCALRPSSGAYCWTWEPSCRNWESSQNFELNPLFNPRGWTVLIPLTMTGYKC